MPIGQYASKSFLPSKNFTLYRFLFRFMHDSQCPPCIIRTSPDTSSMPIDIRYLTVIETENLLDNHEELISTPMKIKFDSMELIILAIPYVIKRSSHRENVIKIRQANGIWISIESNESMFDSYKVRYKAIFYNFILCFFYF